MPKRNFPILGYLELLLPNRKFLTQLKTLNIALWTTTIQ